MLVHVPDHFSTKLKFNIKNTPTIVTDRTPLIWGILGFIFGILMLWLGVFELFSFLKADVDETQSLLMVEIFAFIVILIALGLTISSVFSFIRYKKFYFDGNEFQMIYRPAVGVKHHFKEPLVNYVGVRLRVLFFQSWLFNRNRYIIDLYHQDNNKIIPLYISTKSKNIRKIWEEYAKIFNLPALSVSDRGLVRRECEDLDKSIKELALANKLPFIASGQFPAPDNLEITEEKNKTIIEPGGIYWDSFSTLFLFIAIAAVLILTAGGVYLTIMGTTFSLKYWLFGAILLFAILYFSTKLFTSHILVLDENSISVIETLFGSGISKETILAQKIENIELSYNPSTGRYSLAIVSDDKIITFGNKFPVADLLWLKDFVIRKLIGN